MKHILIAGLLIAATTGSVLVTPARADDKDRRGPEGRGPADRGPRPGGPGDRGPGARGPEGRGPGAPGPRPGGPGDRGPRHDDNDRDWHDRDHRPDWNRDRDSNGRDRWNNRGDKRPWRNWPNSGDRNNRPGKGRGNNGGYGYGGNYGYDYNNGYGGNYGGNYNRPGYNNGNGYGNYGNLETVANRIQSALRNDSQLRRYNIGTDTVGNTIELEGTVRSTSDRQRAIDIARRVSGGVIINATRLQVRR